MSRTRTTTSITTTSTKTIIQTTTTFLTTTTTKQLFLGCDSIEINLVYSLFYFWLLSQYELISNYGKSWDQHGHTIRYWSTTNCGGIFSDIMSNCIICYTVTYYWERSWIGVIEYLVDLLSVTLYLTCILTPWPHWPMSEENPQSCNLLFFLLKSFIFWASKFVSSISWEEVVRRCGAQQEWDQQTLHHECWEGR